MNNLHFHPTRTIPRFARRVLFLILSCAVCLTIQGAQLYYLCSGASGGTPGAGDGLRRINLDATGNNTVFDANSVANANALALDFANNRAFVADSFTGMQKIYAVNLSSGAVTLFLDLTSSSLIVNAMKVDSVNGRLYYLCSGATGGTPGAGDGLRRINLDGTSNNTVFDATTVANGNALALDIPNNRAFVADSFTGMQKIYAVNLSSGAVSQFLDLNSATLTVNAMEVDAANGRLYYLCSGATGGTPGAGDGLRRVNLDGTSNNTVFDATTVANANALALDIANNRAFVADSFTGMQKIYAVNLSSGAVSQFLDLNSATLTVNAMEIPAEPPTISSVSGPSNGTYVTGQNLNFTVNFSTSVTVVTAGGMPTFGLTIGATSRSASYVSGTGTSALLFRYTVLAGDLDANGITSASPIVLNGGTIKDGSGNSATLTFTPPTTSAVLVDAVAPAVTSVNVPANGTYINGQNLNFTVNFGEAVVVNTGGGTPYLTVTLDTGGSVQAAYLSGSGTTALVFRYTVANGNLDNNGISLGSSLTANGGTLKDAAGNNATLTLTAVGSTTGILVDAVAPSITSVNGPANGSYRAGQNLDFTVHYDEAVIVDLTGGTPTFGLTVGVASVNATYLSGSGTSALLFRYPVQSGNTDADGIVSSSPISTSGATIRDAVGNDASLTFIPPNTASVLVDTTAPTVSIGSPDSATTTVGPVSFIVTYTGADSITLTNGNVSLVQTGSADAITIDVTGSGTNTRTVTLSGITGSGTLGINIAAGTASDLAGNTAPAPTTSATFVVNAAPAVARDNGTVVVGEGTAASNTGTFSDADGNATVTLSASVGVITPNNGAGTWSWNFNTTDGPEDSQTVTVSATDGLITNSTTFTLSVTNLLPIAADQIISIAEDTATNLVLTATDPGLDTITNWVVTVGPTNGSLTGTAPNLTYLPNTNFNGSDSFRFTATDSDGAVSAEATVSLTVTPVNEAPVAGADSLARLNNTKVVKVTKASLLANDTDEDNDTLTLTAVANATPPGATVVIAGTFVIYTAPATNAGDGSFTYTVSDGAGGHSVTSTVPIIEVATVPSGAGPNSAAVAPSGSDYVLTFIGVPGHSYRVQYTTSVSVPYTWNEFSPLAIFTAPTNGVFSYTDVNPPGPMRLYRAVPHP